MGSANSPLKVSALKKNSSLKLFLQFFPQVWRNKFTIKQLLKRDFVSVNQRSFLRYFWIFLTPLFASLSWIFLNKAGVLKPGDSGSVPYTVYVLLGTTIWGLFMGISNMVGDSLTSTSAFVNKIYVPHEVFIAKNLFHQLIVFSIGFTFTLIVLFFYGIEFTIYSFLFPLTLVPLILFASAIGLVLSIFSVVMSDSKNLFQTSFGFIVYLTPVMYTKVDNINLQKIIDYNPMTHLIANPRDLLLFGNLYSNKGFVASGIFSFVLFYIALSFFYKTKTRLIEKIF